MENGICAFRVSPQFINRSCRRSDEQLNFATLGYTLYSKAECLGWILDYADWPQCLLTLGEKSPSLTMSAMSSTMCAHDCVHSSKSAISLWWWLALSNPGSLLIVGVKNSVRPIHLFDRNHDHDYYFELPCKGERDTQSLRR